MRLLGFDRDQTPCCLSWLHQGYWGEFSLQEIKVNVKTPKKDPFRDSPGELVSSESLEYLSVSSSPTPILFLPLPPTFFRYLGWSLCFGGHSWKALYLALRLEKYPSLGQQKGQRSWQCSFNQQVY